MVSVGSRLEELQAGPGASLFPAGAAYAQIDADPFAIGRNVVPDIALLGDAALVLDDVATALAARTAGPDARAGVGRDLADAEGAGGGSRSTPRAPTCAVRCSAARRSA